MSTSAVATDARFVRANGIDIHYVELTEGTPPGEASFGHELAGLWSRCRASLETIGASEDELNNVGTAIDELHAMDPRGEAFRYARSRDGSETLANVESLSYDHVHDTLLATG